MAYKGTDILCAVGHGRAIGVDERQQLMLAEGGRADLDRAAAVHPQPPLGDVEMVGAEVVDAAVAVVAVVPPVGEDRVVVLRRQLGVVGPERRGPQPHVPVERLRHRLRRQIALLGGAAHVDVHHLQLADGAVAHQLAGEAEVVVGALLAAHLKNAAVAAGRLGNRLGLADGQRKWLLAVDVLAGLHGLDRLNGVPVGRGGDHDRVDVGAGEQLAEVAIDRNALVVRAEALGIGLPDQVAADLEPVALDIAERDDLNVLAAEAALQMPPHHLAHADQADGDPVARRSLTGGSKGGRRQNHRRGNRRRRACGHATHKFPAGTSHAPSTLTRVLEHFRMRLKRIAILTAAHK